MEAMRETMQSLPADLCPKELRLTLDRWKAGQATDQELIEASYAAQLDLLEAYRWRPAPTPPWSVAEYRALTRQERQAWTDTEQRTLRKNHAEFYAQDAQIAAQNHANRHTLTELLAWATSRALPDAILDSLRLVLAGHHDLATDDAMREEAV